MNTVHSCPRTQPPSIARVVLENVGPALLDGRGEPGLELAEVGLNAVPNPAVLDLGRASLQVGCVLGQCAVQGRRTADKGPRQQREPTNDHDPTSTYTATMATRRLPIRAASILRGR
jgi:hypothetical protein